MPIVGRNGRIVLFAHVPKAGGSSVEAMLERGYGTLGLYEPRWSNRARGFAAFGVSPQHLSAADLARVLPEARRDLSFAVVREPVARICSEFRHHQRAASRRLLCRLGFSFWLEACLAAAARCPEVFDNHFRTQDAMVPDSAEVFRLEDGLDRVAERVADLLGPADPPAEAEGEAAVGVPHLLKGENALPLQLTQTDLARIADTYAADYARFGYPAPDMDGVATRAGPLPRALSGPLARLAGRLIAFAWRHRFIG
ncbi:MAG: sulfotransferase family 2 domain-containing protein [Pseudomonadota bacterium]